MDLDKLACVAVCVAALSVTAAGLVAQLPLSPLPSTSTRSRSDVPQVARRLSSGTAQTSDSTISAAPHHSTTTTQQQGRLTAATPFSSDPASRQDAIVLQGIQTADDSLSSVSVANQALRHQAFQFNLPPELLWQLQQQGFSVQGSPTTLLVQSSNQPSTPVVSTNAENNNFQHSFQHQFPSQFLSNAQIYQQQVPQQSPTAFSSVTSPLQSQFDSQLRSTSPFIQANQRPANSNLFINANQQPHSFQSIPIFQHRSNNFQPLPSSFLQNDQQTSQFQLRPQQQLFPQQNLQQGSAASEPRFLSNSNTHLLNGQFFQQVSPQLQTNTQQIRANPFQFRLNEIGQSFTPVSPVQQTVTQTVFVPVLATDSLDIKPVPSETQRSLPTQDNNGFSFFQEVSTETLQVKSDDLPQPISIQEMIFDHKETQNVASTEENIPRENELQTHIQPAVADVKIAFIADTPVGEAITEGPFEHIRAKEVNPIDISEINSTNKVIASAEQIKVNVEMDNAFVKQTKGLQKELKTVLLDTPTTDDTETGDSSKEIIRGRLEPITFNNMSGIENKIPVDMRILDTEFNNTSTNETPDIQEEIQIVDNSTAVQESEEMTLDDKVSAGTNSTFGERKQINEDGQTIGGDESLSDNNDQETVNNDITVINILDSATEPSATAVTPEEFVTTVDPELDPLSVVSDSPFSYEDVSILDEIATTESQMLMTEAPIIPSVTSKNPQPIITESTVAQRIHRNNVDIIKEHIQPDSITASQISDEIFLANDSLIFSISSDLEEVTEINDDVVPTERNGSNNVNDLFQDEIMPNSFEEPRSLDEASNYTENIIYDDVLAEADTATSRFAEYDYNLESNVGTTSESGTILLNSLDVLLESTTQNIIDSDHPVDYDDNLQFITERAGVVEPTYSNEAAVTSALVEKSEANHIQLEKPRIVERTVISISTTTNPKPTKRNVSSAVQSDGKIVSDLEIMNNTQFASSEHIPTFTIFINPKTGRIFKRSTTAVPPGEIESLMSSIFEKRERDLGTANPRFPRRQGLFTLFNEKQNSNRNANKPENIERITQSTVPDVVEEKEPTSGSEGRLPPRNGSRLLALRKTKPRTLPPAKSRSLSRRFTKQDEVTDTPEVTEAPVEITTETINTGVDAVTTVTETVRASGEDDKIDVNINNTSGNKKSLEEQLKVLLRNKSTQDKVRRRLLTTRTPSARLLGRKAGNQDAQSSIAVETKTLPDTPDIPVQENTDSGPRTLRFNRFRNQNDNQQEQRSDRVRLLATRFKNRNSATDSAVAFTTTTTSSVQKNNKPKQNEALQSRVSDSLRPRFKATRFEGFRRNATNQRRPSIFTPTGSTTTSIPSVLSSFINDIEDNTEKTIVSTTENDLTTATDSTILPESPGIGSVFLDDDDIITLNPPVSIETEIETSTSSSFIEKFTEFLHNPTENVLTSSKMHVSNKTHETKSKELLINIDTTTAMGDQENTPFIPTDLSLVQSELENLSTAIFDDSVVNIPLEDTTEQLNNVFDELFTESFLGNHVNFRSDPNTESIISTSTLVPSTIFSDNTEVTHDDNQRVAGLQNFDSNEVTGRKAVNLNLEAENAFERTNETVSDIFSKMLMSIAKPQAILESMNAHVPTGIVNIRNGLRSAKGLLGRNIVGSSPASSAEDVHDPAQFLTTPDAKKSGAENLNLTNGISVSSLTQEISKMTNRFRPSVHNLESNQGRTVEDATLKKQKPSIVPSLQPVAVEAFNSDQDDIISDSINEGIQIAEPPFALDDSIHDENQLLRSKSLVTTETNQIISEREELKHELMKGDFSLLIDGTLLEEVMANRKSTLENTNRTRGIRLFDVPVMMNIPKLTPNSEQVASLSKTDIFITSDEKTLGQLNDVLSGSNNRLSSVFDPLVTIADGDSSGTEPSPFQQTNAESFDLKHPPIDQFVRGDLIGPHPFETPEAPPKESFSFEQPAQEGIDFSPFVDEIFNNKTPIPQTHEQLPAADELDAHQSRQDDSIVTEFPITNQQSEFDYDSIFEPSQLEFVEDPSTINETNQFVQVDNVVSSPKFFSSDLSSKSERQFEQDENVGLLTSVEDTTLDNPIDIAELEPTNVIAKPVKTPLFHELFPLFPKEKLSQPNIVQIGTTATPDTTAEPPTTQSSSFPHKITEPVENIESIAVKQPSFLQNMEVVLPIIPRKINLSQRGENVLRPVKVDQLFFEQPIPTTIDITTRESEGEEKLLFAHENFQLSTPETTADLFEFEQFITTDGAKSSTTAGQLTTTEKVESFTEIFEPFDLIHNQHFNETLADITSETSIFGSDEFVEESTLSSPLDGKSFAENGVLEEVPAHKESIIHKFESTTERFSDLFGFIITEEKESVTEINLPVLPISVTNKTLLNTEFSNEVGTTINEEIVGTHDNFFVNSTLDKVDHIVEKPNIRHFGQDVSAHEETTVPKFESATESFSALFGVISTEKPEPVTEINLSESAILVTNKMLTNTEFPNELGSTNNDKIQGTSENLFDSSSKLDETDHLIENQEIGHFGQETMILETPNTFETEQESLSNDPVLPAVQETVKSNDNEDFERVSPSSVQTLIPRVVVLNDIGQSPTRGTEHQPSTAQNELNGSTRIVHHANSGLSFNSVESKASTISLSNHGLISQEVLSNERKGGSIDDNILTIVPNIDRLKETFSATTPSILTKLDSDVRFSVRSDETNTNNRVRLAAISKQAADQIRNENRAIFQTSIASEFPNEAVLKPEQRNQDVHKVAEDLANEDVLRRNIPFEREIVIERHASKNNVPDNLVVPTANEETEPLIAQEKIIRITSFTLLTPAPPLRPRATPFPRRLIPRPLQSNFLVEPAKQKIDSKQLQNVETLQVRHNAGTHDLSKTGDVDEINVNTPHDEVVSETVSSKGTIAIDVNEPAHPFPVILRDQPSSLLTINQNEDSFENHQRNNEEVPTTFFSLSTENINHVPVETTTEEITTTSTQSSVEPFIASTTESIVPSTTDTLHNFTNDELLILDLLADIVESSPTSTTEIPPVRVRGTAGFRTTGREQSTQNSHPQDPPRDSKSIETSKRVFSTQHLQFISKETNLGIEQPPVSFESSDNGSNRADRVVVRKTIFPPPLRQFPQMPSITTPKPVFMSIPHRTNNRSQRLNQHETSTPSPFGFAENFPFHVFDSFTGHNMVRQRSVSSSRGNTNSVSPNFSFFQVFNPPQSARLESKTSIPDTTPFPFLGRSAVTQSNDDIQPQPIRNINERSITSQPSRMQALSRLRAAGEQPTIQRQDQSSTRRPKIVSMRTKSGSLFFVPEDRVAQTMKLGMGTPLVFTNSPIGH